MLHSIKTPQRDEGYRWNGLKRFLGEETLRTVVPIRIDEHKILLKGRMKSVPPTGKMRISLRDLSKQLNFRRAAGSQKKWGMMLSAQNDSWTKRRVCNRAWIQQRNQDPATKETHSTCLMMVLEWRG